MLRLTFVPESARIDLTNGAAEYAAIWVEGGERIVPHLEALSGVCFVESAIEATIIEGPSQSHPLRLRASYQPDVKRGTLVHELAHRLVYGRSRIVKDATSPAARQLASHKLINLFLYDAWTDLYGRVFADQQVGVETARRQVYRDAWEWALAIDRPTRAATLARWLRQPD